MKVKTMAKEVQDDISKDIPYLYPWALQKHKVKSVNYDIVLSDINTYWSQPAHLREGFHVSEDEVTIPTFFTKLNGVMKNKKEYNRI